LSWAARARAIRILSHKNLNHARRRRKLYIGDAAIEHVADERLHLWNDGGERVPIISIARQRATWESECFTVVATLTLTPSIVAVRAFPG
jgi:hypothetical protein